MNEPAYMDYFGVSRADARVLGYLWDCANKTAPRSAEAISAAAVIPSASVKATVAHLQDAMNAEAIDIIPGRADRDLYLLTETGLEECRLAVSEYRKARAA